MAKASGKIILFGEHAVVYGYPGIAVPVKDAAVEVSISPSDYFSYETDRELYKEEKERLNDLLELLFFQLHAEKKDMEIKIRSTIPVASGMGSSAALSVALIRAIAEHLGKAIDDKKVNEIAFECEKMFHGTPSGIDNTVVTYGKPVYFYDGEMYFLKLKKPLHLVIANTGIKSPTKEAVLEVRQRYERDREEYSALFEKIGQIAGNAKTALESGETAQLGGLMDKNHALLQQIGVSCKELDELVSAAKSAGALGAKLAGAGKGGNMVALVEQDKKDGVMNSMKKLSKNIIYTEVKP
ncbi:TPA: mevalonate kinase [Candidatus Woesearchaeota archaeon]|nr:Mevalonate kinase [archaeon GW2011_AR15]MBS3103709.1 mevalonate kinase [Candidatus Woesearchaeota archaeon]HIH41001.1 mevalonate kinase [Candidatus Woesearchaeota archaeon]